MIYLPTQLNYIQLQKLHNFFTKFVNKYYAH